MPSRASAESPKPIANPEQDYKQDYVARWAEGIAKWEEHMRDIENAFYRYADGPAEEKPPSGMKVSRERLTVNQNKTMRSLYDKFEELKFSKLKKPTKVTRSDLGKLSEAIKHVEKFQKDVLTVVGSNDNLFCVGDGCGNLTYEAEFYPNAKSVEYGTFFH